MSAVITKWDDLQDFDRERLIMMLGSLEEFYAGVALFEPILPTDHRENRPAHRFYRNALFQYLDSFYTEGNNGILPVLDSIGQKRFADTVRSVLNKPVGTLTVGNVLRTWRNLGIAHLTFQPGHILTQLRGADLEAFMTNVYFLVKVTTDFRDLFRLAYPEAVYLNIYPDDPVEHPTS
jgi:hypothetical protein